MSIKYYNQIDSQVTTGTAPFVIASTSLVINLNSERFNSQVGSYYLDTSATVQTKSGSLNIYGTVSHGISSTQRELFVTEYRTLGTTFPGTIEICSITMNNCIVELNMSLAGGSTVNGSAKFVIPCQYSQSGGTWLTVLPINSTLKYGGVTYIGLEASCLNNTLTLRLRRVAAAGPDNILIGLRILGESVTYTTSSTTGTSAAATAFWWGANLTLGPSGYGGINTNNSTVALDVVGTVKATALIGPQSDQTVVVTPTTAGWYRIASVTSSDTLFGRIIIYGNDNVSGNRADMEFVACFPANGYTPTVQVYNWLNLNSAALVTQIRASNDGANNSYLDIYLPYAWNGGTFVILGYGVKLPVLVQAPVVGAAAGAYSRTVTCVQGVATTGQFRSDIATGTAPLIIASTSLVSNLNVERFNSQVGSYYLDTSATVQTKTSNLVIRSTTSGISHEYSNTYSFAGTIPIGVYSTMTDVGGYPGFMFRRTSGGGTSGGIAYAGMADPEALGDYCYGIYAMDVASNIATANFIATAAAPLAMFSGKRNFCRIYTTRATTSTTVASLVVDGGVGIASHVFIGGTAAITSTLTTSSGRISKITVDTSTALTLDATHHFVTTNNAASITVTLPAASSNTGREYWVSNLGAGSVTMGSITLTTGQVGHVVSNGTSWIRF